MASLRLSESRLPESYLRLSMVRAVFDWTNRVIYVTIIANWL